MTTGRLVISCVCSALALALMSAAGDLAVANERLLEVPVGEGVSGLQGLASTNGGRTFYTLRLSSRASGSLATVEQYAVSSSAPYLSLTGRIEGIRGIGHQGLSAQMLPGEDVRLWTTSYDDKRSAFFFGVKEGGQRGSIRLFESRFLASVSSSPAISSDGRYLIAQGKRQASPERTTIRVWSLQDISCLQETANCTRQYLFEWTTDIAAEDYPVQAIASDGVSVWIISGNESADQGKRLARYALDGTLISLNSSFSLGLAQILREYGPFSGYEPEGLSVYRDLVTKDLKIDVGFSVGRRQQRQAAIVSFSTPQQ